MAGTSGKMNGRGGLKEIVVEEEEEKVHEILFGGDGLWCAFQIICSSFFSLSRNLRHVGYVRTSAGMGTAAVRIYEYHYMDFWPAKGGQASSIVSRLESQLSSHLRK